MQNISDRDFQREVLGAPGLVLVDFWASWCPPCRALAPVLESLERRFQGGLKVVKINVDQNQEWANRLGVSGIPALFFFRDGKLVDRQAGFIPEAPLGEHIRTLQGAA